MSQMINRGRELIRISPEYPYEIEYSTNGGQSWNRRYSASYSNEFLDLVDNGKEIVAQMSDGLYYSTNEGQSWNLRRREKRRSSASASANASEDDSESGGGLEVLIFLFACLGFILKHIFKFIVWAIKHPPVGWILLGGIAIAILILVLVL